MFLFNYKYDIVSCTIQPTYKYVLGILLCLGGMISYFPQYYSLIKSKQKEGISEISLFVLNIGSVCLTFNAFILNWDKFKCYNDCSFWLCTANLLSVIQIAVGWVMVFPLYLIFIRYKIRESNQRIIYDLIYIFIYVLFFLVMIIAGLSEKIKNNNLFFSVSAFVLGGIISPCCSCLVWIPQIITLLKTQRQGNLSLVMFIIQTPGNVFIIVFQILYHQNLTTWFTYIILLIEQLSIVIILLVFKYREYRSDIVDIIPNEYGGYPQMNLNDWDDLDQLDQLDQMDPMEYLDDSDQWENPEYLHDFHDINKYENNKYENSYI